MALVFRTLRLSGAKGKYFFPGLWVRKGHFVRSDTDYLAVFLMECMCVHRETATEDKPEEGERCSCIGFGTGDRRQRVEVEVIDYPYNRNANYLW
jgi:hypothetical protein